MSEHENVGIELGVNADGALQTLQELTTAAKAADATIQELKQHMTEQVNAAFGAQGLRPQNYEQAQGFLQRMPAADLAAASPEIVATQQAISARSGAITGAAMDVAGAPGAANQPAQQLLDQVRQLLTVQQQQQATGGASANAGAGNGSLARYGATPSDGGGSPWPASTPAFGSNPTPDTSQQDRGANLIGERMAQALTRSAGGLMAGGISGAANAAGMGATGDLLSGLARPLMGMLGEFAAPLAAGVGVVGAALGVNSAQTHYEQEKQALSATEGTTTGATPTAELVNAQRTGWQYLYHEQESVAAAQQLGSAGVSSSQMGGALNASLALARVGNISTGEAAGLTGQLMGAGQSSTQVGDTYAQMDQAARVTGVSLTRLINGIKDLGQAAGIGQISVNGLAAATAISGLPGSTFAQAISGTVGSTGTSALSQGAMLGLTPTQFEAAQRDPAKLMDSYANLARRYDVGTGGVQVAQQALSSAGFDFSGMKGPQADEFTRRLVAQGPGAAQAYEASLTKKETALGAPGPHNAADFYKAGIDAANRVNTELQKGAIWAEQIQAKMALAEQSANNIADAASRDPRFTKSGTDLSAGPNPQHIQPTRPYDSTAILGRPSPYDLGIKIDGSGSVTPTALARQAHANQVAVDAHNRTIQQAALQNNQVVDASKIGFDASGDARFGAISGTAVNQGMAGQLKIAGASLSASTFAALQSAAQRTGVPLSVLLAQSRQEATVNGKVDPSAISPDGGYGLGQFTDQASAMKYLGQASRELGQGPVTNWHTAALDPKIGAQAMADYDAANLASKASGGRWDKALSQYNAGPGGWDVTGKPGQGRDYGTGITSSAEQVQHTLGITVTVQDQNGNKVGQTKTQHNINTSKKVVAAQSYGPTGDTSPTVGLPLQLPPHFK